MKHYCCDLLLLASQGGHAQITHDPFSTKAVQHIKEIGIHALGGGFVKCRGYLSEGNIRPEDEHMINGIIPCALINGRGY